MRFSPSGRASGRVAIAGLVSAALLVPAGPAAAGDGGQGSEAAHGDAGRSHPQRDALQQAVDAVVDAGVPGVIAEVRDEEGAWRGTSGVANLDRDRAPRPHGRFRIGSVTKTFVATAVLQLADEGEVELDAPVERYLPDVIPGDQGITVRQLLNHTSGLYNYTRDLFAGEDIGQVLDKVERLRFRPFQPDDLLTMAMRHEPEFQPDPETGVWYSNTNYVLLGRLIEEVTGHSPRREIRERIVRPLGLRRTAFPEWNPFIFGPNPHGYEVGPDSSPLDVTAYSPSWARMAGAGVSTASDVNRFYRALLSGELLSTDMLGEMQRTVTLPEGPGPGSLEYGLGLVELQGCSGPIWGHTGGIPGFTTYTFSSPDGQQQLTLSANEGLTAGNDADVAAAINDVLLTVFCGPAATQDAGPEVDITPLPDLGPLRGRS